MYKNPLFRAMMMSLFIGSLCLAQSLVPMDPTTVSDGHVYLLEDETDSSTNGNTGILIGAPQIVDGLTGPAMQFNGVDDGVQLPNAATINTSVHQNKTVIAVFSCDDVSKTEKQTVFEEGGTTRGLNIYVHEGLAYAGGWNPADYTPQWPGTFISAPIKSNEWHVVVAVLRGGGEGMEDDKFEMWMDGQLIGKGPGAQLNARSNANAIGQVQSQSKFHDGNITGGGAFFQGIIDEVWILNTALTEAELSVLGPNMTGAKNPVPDDAVEDVLRDNPLSWAPGKYAATHNLYFGDNLDDVNTGTTPLAVLDVNTFDPGRLEFGTTYYWRVDEVNGTPDKTVFKGDVWRFTAEPYSIQIPGSDIVVTASSSSNEFSLPEKLIDGSGLGTDDAHDIVPEAMWFTATVDLDPWIQFEFDGVKQLDTMKTWNSNGAAESAIGWGVKDVVIEYSVDGENWTVLPDATQLSRASGLPTYAQPDEIAFNGVPAKMVRLDIESNWGGVLMSYGLSEVQFTMIPSQARTPEPASGTTDIQPDDTVTWRAGREAATHTVTIGTDANAVANGTAPSVTTNTNGLDLSTLDLQLGETYYWRVDEVNDAEETTVWTGPVWSLSIVPTMVVDDFEDYGTISPDRPFQTWLDGFGYSADEFFAQGYAGNGTGAGIGHDIWSLSSPYYDGDIMETATVISGSTRSLPLYFDNASGASQTDRTFAPAQDWTLGGITTLSVAVHGNADLSAANTLYAEINGTKVPYDGDLSVPIWRPWHVDLAALGINLSSVSTLSIGVEGAGSGLVLLDDILLHKTPPAINEPPAGGDKSLVAHWTLDETEGLDVADSSGYGNHGTLVGLDGTAWTTGTQGGALEITGGSASNNTYVRFENTSSLQLSDSATISVWVKMAEGNDDAYMGIAGKLASGTYKGFSLVRHDSNVFRLWCDDGAGVIAGHEASSDTTYTDTEWHHVAGVVDNGTSILYVDGVRQIQEGAVDLTDSGTYAHIGKQYGDNSSHRYWTGLVDEVRIYYRALSEAEIQGL